MSSSQSQDERLSPNNRPSHGRHLSRSPHPYHRIGSRRPGHHDHSNQPSSPSQWPRTSSESGTEADDEGAGFLRGLPAPPLRPRKGLRSGRDGGEDHDPVLPVLPRWPSFVRSTSRRSSGDGTDSDTAKEREKIKRKRDIEVLRRVSETALLMAVAATVLLREDTRSLAWSWRKGMTILDCLRDMLLTG